MEIKVQVLAMYLGQSTFEIIVMSKQLYCVYKTANKISTWNSEVCFFLVCMFQVEVWVWHVA
jgi:hypothetical protein